MNFIARKIQKRPSHSLFSGKAALAGVLMSALPWLTGCETAVDKAASARLAAAEGNMNAPIVYYSDIKMKPRTSIAVLPFEVSDNVAKTREFERTFFAANLVKMLQESPVSKKAVFAPAETPAVDYVVRCSASPSPEKIWTFVKVEDLSGRVVWQGPYTDAEWDRIANRVIKEIAADMDPLTESDRKRVGKYSEGVVTEPTEKAVAIANVAANLEREKLLSRFTELALANAEHYARIYENFRERQQELARQAEEENQRQTASMLSGVAAGLGGVSAAASGNQYGVSQAQARMAQAQVDVAASGNRQANLELASQKLSLSFGAAVSPTAITFLDKVYELSGSYEEQLKEFRQLVKKSLEASVAPGTSQ
jgi:hypothetical protein